MEKLTKTKNELSETEKHRLKAQRYSAFADLWLQTAAIYGITLSAERIAADFQELGHYSIPRLTEAIRGHRRTPEASRFFPQPGQILTFLPDEATDPKVESIDPPCGCSKEQLIALRGAECEHGYCWGLGFFRDTIKEFKEKNTVH